MSLHRRRLIATGSGFALAIFVVFASASVSRAGGFKIPDQSTRAMGMIDAFIAGADDASAVYYNPAGITRLTRPEMISNIYFAHAITYYDGTYGSETSDGRFYVVPSFYFATPVKGLDNLFVGLGVYSPYGLGSKWGDSSLVRYTTTLAEIQLVNINPTVAYKINDSLAVGAGIDYFESRAKMRSKFPIAPGVDGEQDVDADGHGWGYNLGIQYQASETVRLGLTYRSQVTIPYDGDMQVDLGPGAGLRFGLNGDIEYPQVIGAGIMWQATPKLRLELAAEWQDWATRKTQDFTITPGGVISAQTDWKESWLFMLGAEYELNDKWTVRAGYGYNETPVPNHTAEPSLPTGDTHAVALGAGYKYSENITLDVAGIVAYGEKRTISDPNPIPPLESDYSGDYQAISFYLSFGIRYQF